MGNFETALGQFGTHAEKEGKGLDALLSNPSLSAADKTETVKAGLKTRIMLIQ